jgi:arylsulfatase A
MKRISLVTCISLLTLIGFAQKRPNVIFILADDLGYGDLGCYGQEQINTPNLDRLANDGIRFTQHYAGTSVCAPSRAAVMTGQHTGHTPVRGNYEIQPEGQYPLPDSTYTMAEMFKKAGYTTGLFGKWGLGYPGSEGEPNKQGFDQFFGYNCQRQSHNFFPGHLWDNRNKVILNNTPSNQQQYAPDLIQAKALDFMKANKEKPFFMYLAYTLPHAGLQLPKGDKVFEEYKKKFNEQPKAIPQAWDGVGYQPQAFPRATYAAMVTKLDHYVGEVIANLKALGIDKNTLVIFTSDNGPHREGGYQPEFFNSSGGFRGIKRDLYEGGIREPMIVNWPAVIKKGRQSDHIGASWDLFPTFAELVGQPVLGNMDGISFLPLLRGKGKQQRHEFLYWEFHEDGGRQAVRMGNWKGVRLNVKKEKNAHIQLFDLAKDPKESNDISVAHPEIVKQIARIMEEEHVEVETFPLLKQQGVTSNK